LHDEGNNVLGSAKKGPFNYRNRRNRGRAGLTHERNTIVSGGGGGGGRLSAAVLSLDFD